MEDVLDLYYEPYDGKSSVICFDESSKALRGHERDPLPARPGAVARVDHRYERNGNQRIHLATEPETGWVTVEIAERRRTTEWIDRAVEITDVHYPDAVVNLRYHRTEMITRDVLQIRHMALTAWKTDQSW